ncbi:MAG: RNA-binding protein [Thaumarchaeota archaeon]|nr:RNA-binding protein [Nitrososphaerota archaeon]
MSSEIHNVLNEWIKKTVSIKLTNGNIVRGTLKGFDQQMNLILENSEYSVDNKTQSLGNVILRAANIITVYQSLT